MKSYKVKGIYPGWKFAAGDILTRYPSGNENESRYGCRVDFNWLWITDPEKNPLVLDEIIS